MDSKVGTVALGGFLLSIMAGLVFALYSVHTMKGEMADLRTQVADLNEKKAKLEERNTSLRDQLVVENSQTASVSAANNWRLKKDLADAKLEVATATTATATTTKELASATSSLAKANAEIAKLTRALRRMRADNANVATSGSAAKSVKKATSKLIPSSRDGVGYFVNPLSPKTKKGKVIVVRGTKPPYSVKTTAPATTGTTAVSVTAPEEKILAESPTPPIPSSRARFIVRRPARDGEMRPEVLATRPDETRYLFSIDGLVDQLELVHVRDLNGGGKYFVAKSGGASRAELLVTPSNSHPGAFEFSLSLNNRVIEAQGSSPAVASR